MAITTGSPLPFPERICEICADLKKVIDEFRPELAVMERIFFAANKRTAFDVAQARGALLLTLKAAGLTLMEPTPLQLKSSITGDGRADKRQMQDMIMRILKLTERPSPDDASDALALAIYGASLQQYETLKPAPRAVH